MTTREEKGLQIATAAKLRQKGAVWVVPSQTHQGSYVVDVAGEQPSCSCPDYEINQNRCKHIISVELFRQKVITPDGTTTVTERVRVTYTQDWSAYNSAQTHEKEHFMVLLRGLCDGIQQAPQGKGRPRLPLADVIFGAAMKVYGTMSGRRSVSDLRDAEDKGLVDEAPHYNSVFRYVEDPSLAPLLKSLITESALPLRAVESAFAVDGTGFATCNYRRWFDYKYGKDRKEHTWLKAHLMCGVKTNIVTSVEVTDADCHDSPQFPALVEATAQNFNVAELMADKGYSSKRNVEVASRLGAAVYIPFLSSIGRVDGPETWRKLFGFYQYQRPAFLARYHQRSNIESTNSMIKRKFGPSLRSKKYDAQVNEILLKVLCHNLCVLVASIYEMGLEPTFWAGSTVAPKGGADSAF